MEEAIINGWKGKSGIKIDNHNDDVILIREFRKHKETGKIYEQITRIRREWVRNLWAIMKKNCVVGQWYGYRFLVNKIIEFYGFDVDLEAWNGGKNRSKYFFKYHYYPLKYLESINYIHYSGRGGIIRLKEGELI